tara:strand:- start:7160 stop:8212 length:1053 start_codon:yes stop_codon:yes gene_type:complete
MVIKMDSFHNLFESTIVGISVCLFIIAMSWFGIFTYRRIAVKKNILANPNFRSLHENPIPKGGGIVFSFIFVVCIIVLWFQGKLSENLFWVLGVGGFIAALFGFIDDLINIRASRKLLVQVFLSVWVLFWFDGGPLSNIALIPNFIAVPLSIFFMVWMINAYNFMDGVDGMAVAGAVFVSGSLALVMLLTHGSLEVTTLFLLLIMSIGAFIVFNWPPASIFMGDAGSVFLGYVFGSLILFTVMNVEIIIWTWLTVFGYFFADTTVTQIARVILVKKWYGAHRSHAYQNLARITDSHLKITLGVTFYHLVWILPLTFWTVIQPELAMFAAFLAITPGMILTYKYGPILSSS